MFQRFRAFCPVCLACHRYLVHTADIPFTIVATSTTIIVVIMFFRVIAITILSRHVPIRRACRLGTGCILMHTEELSVFVTEMLRPCVCEALRNTC